MKALRFLAVVALSSASASEIQWVSDAVIEKAKQAVVTVKYGEQNAMNGFFVSEDGLILTLAGPLEGLRQVDVVTSGGKVIHGSKLVALDRATDLAVLATGQKAPAYLPVHATPVEAGEVCALLYFEKMATMVTDGKLLVRRDNLDISQTGFTEYWSIALSPSASIALMGAPVITRDGRVAGIYQQMASGGQPSQRFAYALPETAIRSIIARARESTHALDFPKRGSSLRYGMPESDADYGEGMKLYSQGKPAGAIEKFRLALQRMPENPIVMTRLGSCLAQTGDLAGAQKVLEAVTRLAPERVGVRTNLAWVLNELGDQTKTIQYLDNLLTQFPKLVGTWSLLGENLLKAGRKEEAVAATKKGAELMPDSMDAWTHYAEALLANGKFSEASDARAHVNELESLFFKLKYSAPHR